MDGNSPILAPLVALVIWTMVMWLWMYATRIPAMAKAKIDVTPGVYQSDDLKKLPAKTHWKAENYNHLHEQPVIFYAIVLTLALVGGGEGLNLTLAWSYVGIRIVHSVWHSMFNIIPVRFGLFVLSNIPLVWLIVNAACIVF